METAARRIVEAIHLTAGDREGCELASLPGGDR
jgi:hypothetical protein